MQENWVQSLGWEDLLEEGMATYSSILAWRIPWAEEACGLQPKGTQRVEHDWVTNTLFLPSSFIVKNRAHHVKIELKMKNSGGASGKESTCQFETQETQVQSLGWKDPLE